MEKRDLNRVFMAVTGMPVRQVGYARGMVLAGMPGAVP